MNKFFLKISYKIENYSYHSDLNEVQTNYYFNTISINIYIYIYMYIYIYIYILKM